MVGGAGRDTVVAMGPPSNDRLDDLTAVLLVAEHAVFVEQCLDAGVRAAAGVPLTIEPVDHDTPSAWRSRVVLDAHGIGSRPGERLRLATVTVGHALARAQMAFDCSGPWVEDIPKSAMHRTSVRELPVPPLGAPAWGWGSPRWVRQLWATPARRALMAIGWLALAAWGIEDALTDTAEYRTARGWFAGAIAFPVLVTMFAPVLIRSLVDLARHRNRFPSWDGHLYTLWPSVVVGVAFAVWVATAG